MALRVLHSIESLSDDAGSRAICVRGLVAALDQSGIASELLTPDSAPQRPWPVNVRHFASGMPDVSDFDVVHMHGWAPRPFCRAVARAAQAAGIPLVISAGGDLTRASQTATNISERLRRHFVDRKLLTHAAAICAGNESEVADLASQRCVDRAHVLPYGFDFSAFAGEPEVEADMPESPEGRCLLLMAPVDPEEGHALLLRALAEIGRESDGWNVALVGPEHGHWRKSIEAAIRRKGGVARVQFASAPTSSLQAAWLRRASLLVVAGLHTIVPVSLHQGLATGVAVVCTERVAPPELSTICTTCDASRDGMKKALRSMLTLDDAALSSQGEASREKARALYDWPVLVPRYVSLYEGLR
ncbi:MAG: glycosyltransferase family 4 protein [Planctomycetota bacterium]|jgi:glycosyltransferase involved in cell wall biosynthesis